MTSTRNVLLNKFLLASIFLGMVMILIKEKEGFASHYHNIDELYKGPILKEKKDGIKYSLKKNAHLKKKSDGIRVGNYSKLSENYTLHPCNDNGNNNDICNELYKANDVVVGPKQKSCMPGFDCRRVGFYCSLID
jgi:hypothetical protein